MKSRYAMKSQEEVWVIVCYTFFNNHSDWSTVEQHQAMNEMMIYSKGQLNPVWLEQKIKQLYQSVGL